MASNITTRTNFLQTVNVDDVLQKDLGSFELPPHYKFDNVSYYKVREVDVARPDLISYRCYGTTNYWWFLMEYNGICDIWNDIFEDQILEIPSLNDIRTYIREL